jgi:hypothetical protein
MALRARTSAALSAWRVGTAVPADGGPRVILDCKSVVPR